MAAPTNRHAESKALFNSIMQGLNTPGRNGVGSSPFGAVAAFMGVPNLAGGPMRNGQYGGMQGIMDRLRQQQGLDSQNAVDPNAPTIGGNLPPIDPNVPTPLPGDKFKKNLIPDWWEQWYRSQGQYGGLPPVDGLL